MVATVRSPDDDIADRARRNVSLRHPQGAPPRCGRYTLPARSAAQGEPARVRHGWGPWEMRLLHDVIGRDPVPNRPCHRVRPTLEPGRRVRARAMTRKGVPRTRTMAGGRRPACGEELCAVAALDDVARVSKGHVSTSAMDAANIVGGNSRDEEPRLEVRRHRSGSTALINDGDTVEPESVNGYAPASRQATSCASTWKTVWDVVDASQPSRCRPLRLGDAGPCIESRCKDQHHRASSLGVIDNGCGAQVQ